MAVRQSIVFLPVVFQFVWISHPDAVVSCVIPSGLWTSCVPVSHRHVTHRAVPSGGTVEAGAGMCLLRGSSAPVNVGISPSPAQTTASGPGAEMGLRLHLKNSIGLSGLSFMAGSSRNTEGLSRC